MNFWHILFISLVSIYFLPKIFGQLLLALEGRAEDARKSALRAKSFAGQLFTLDNQLSTSQAVAINAASFPITAAGVVLGILGYQLLAPVVGPLLGVDVNRMALNTLPAAAIWALVIAPSLAGIWLTDLAGISAATQISRISRGRGFAFALALLTACIGILALAATGGVKAVVELEPLLGSARVDFFAGLFGSFVVVAADVLVALGIFIAFPCFDCCARSCLAFMSIIIWAGLNLCAFIIWLLQVVLSPLCEILASFRQFLSRFVAGARSSFGRGLSPFLGPVGPGRNWVDSTPPCKPPKTNGAAWSAVDDSHPSYMAAKK